MASIDNKDIKHTRNTIKLYEEQLDRVSEKEVDDVKNIMENLAELCKSIGDYENEIVYRKKVINFYVSGTPEYCSAQKALAVAFTRSKSGDIAANFKAAIEIYDNNLKILTEDSFRNQYIENIIEKAANLLENRASCFEEAIRAQAILTMGDAYFELAKLEEKEENLKKALEAYKASHILDFPEHNLFVQYKIKVTSKYLKEIINDGSMVLAEKFRKEGEIKGEINIWKLILDKGFELHEDVKTMAKQQIEELSLKLNQINA